MPTESSLQSTTPAIDIYIKLAQYPVLADRIRSRMREELFQRGVITKANLIVATQNNAARIAMSVEKAAKGLISNGHVSDGILNQVEMAFRAYDPCHACATHSLPGSMPLVLTVRDGQGATVATIRRDRDGRPAAGRKVDARRPGRLQWIAALAAAAAEMGQPGVAVAGPAGLRR